MTRTLTNKCPQTIGGVLPAVLLDFAMKAFHANDSKEVVYHKQQYKNAKHETRERGKGKEGGGGGRGRGGKRRGGERREGREEKGKIS